MFFYFPCSMKILSLEFMTLYATFSCSVEMYLWCVPTSVFVANKIKKRSTLIWICDKKVFWDNI